MDSQACVRIVSVEDVSHEAGWSQRWVELLSQEPPASPDARYGIMPGSA